MIKKNKQSKKILIGLGCASLAAAATASFMATATATYFASSHVSTNTEQQAKDTTRAVGFNLQENIVINVSKLDKTYANYYFSELDFKNQTDQFATKVLESIKTEINANAGYWVNNNKPPKDYDLKVIAAIINDNSNPNVTPGFTNAIKVGLIDKDSGKEVGQTVISLVGFKTILGKTYPVDTFKGDFSNTQNTKASFVWGNEQFVQNGTLTAPTPDQVKQELMKEDSNILKTIFANLPDAENFKNEDNDIQIDLIANDEDVYQTYKIYNYKITLNKTLIVDSNGNRTNKNPIPYDLQIYVPLDLPTINQDDVINVKTVAKTNIVFKNTVNDSTNIKTASLFDALRITNNQAFNEKFKALIPTILFHAPNDLSLEDFKVEPMIGSSSSSFINDNLGLVAYRITLRRYKIANETPPLGSVSVRPISFNVVISGFDKISETQFFNSVSVHSIDTLRNKFPTQFINEQVNEQDLMHVMANNKISVYRGGSFVEAPNPDNRDVVAKDMFQASKVTYNFAKAIYNDLNGSISNVDVTIIGYYNKKGYLQSTNETAKHISLTINGFKKTASNIPTRVDQIDVSGQYENYPAQAFITGLKTDGTANTMAPTPNPIPDNVITEIKKLISENIGNLPDTPDNQNKDNWIVENIMVNNFNGTITGQVAFPDIYITNENNLNVIHHNFNGGTQNPPAGYKTIPFVIQGFSIVNGGTSVSSIRTNQVIFENDFGYNAPIEAATMTWTEFKQKVNDINQGNTNAFAENVIKYFALDTNKVFDNKWAAFNEQFAISGTPTVVEDQNNQEMRIDFKANIFKADGSYGLSETVSITIYGFRKDSSVKPDQISSSITPDGILNNATLESRSMFIDEVEAKVRQNDASTLNDIAGLISKSLANNIKAVTGNDAPTYNIQLDTTIPEEDKLPGYLYLKVNFKTNYYVAGQFVTQETNDAVSQQIVPVQIFGFKTRGTTSIANIINVEQTYGNVKPGDFAKDPANVTKINEIIKENIAALPGTLEETVDFLWDGTTNQPNSIGGIEYYGIPNNIEGTLEIAYKFKANKWFKDGKEQTVDSEIRTTTLVGFMRLNEDELNQVKWFNSEFNIDVSQLREKWDGNALASMIVEKAENKFFSEEIKQIFKSIILERNGLIKNDLYDTLKPVLERELVIDYKTINADNTSGTAVISMTAKGQGIYDPSNGLPCENKELAFKVIVFGFDHATPTTYIPSITLDAISEDANASHRQLKLKIADKQQMNSLFANTLPKGFWNLGEDAGSKYIFLPTQTFSTNAQDANFEYDYGAGTIKIKEMALFYYYDTNNNLVMPQNIPQFEADISEILRWEQEAVNEFKQKFYQEGQTPTGDQKYQYKLITDVTVGGFKKAKPTIIKKQVVVNYNNITPSDFIAQVIGDPADPKYNRLISKLIYNPPKKGIYNNTVDEEGKIVFYPDLSPVNNLPQYVDNYSNWSDKEPVLRLVKGANDVEYDNKKGTIILNLSITNRFYYEDPQSKKILWKPDAGGNTPNVTGKIQITGFKSTSPTVIKPSHPIGDLKGVKYDIFSYVIGEDLNANNGNQIYDEKNLYKLIIDNADTFIKSGFVLNEITDIDYSDPAWLDNAKKYMTIGLPTDENGQVIPAADFTNGSVKFTLSLKKYYDQDGVAIDTTVDNTKQPKTQQILLNGFPSARETTLINKTIDMKLVENTPWDDIPFYSTEEDIKNAIVAFGINDTTKNLAFINDNFLGLPKGIVYDSFENTATTPATLSIGGVVVQDKGDINTFSVSFTITLKNAIINKEVNGKRFNTYGTYSERITLTNWAGRVQTKINPVWPLLNASKTFNWDEYFKKTEDERKAYVANFLQENDRWKKYTINIGTGNKTTRFQLDNIVSTSPANASKSMVIEVTITGTYDDQLTWDDSRTLTATVTLQNLPVQTQTVIERGKVIRLNTFADERTHILPHKLVEVVTKDGNSKAYTPDAEKFIEFLNTYRDGKLIKDELFSNAYFPEKADVNTRTKVIGFDVVNYDDTTGSANLNLKYINYYDTEGRLILDENTPAISETITFTEFATASITRLGNQYIDVNKYFAATDGSTTPLVLETFQTLTPVEIVDDIERRVLANEDPKLQIAQFKESIAEITKPLFVGASLPLDQWAQKNEVTSNSYLDISDKSVLITNEIVIPGRITAGKGNKLDKKQVLQDTIKMRYLPGYTTIDPSEGPQIDIRKSFIANNRLGELSFQMALIGFWQEVTSENQLNKKVIETEPFNGSIPSDTEVTILTLTITGLKKDVSVETQSAELIIISASVAGGVAAIMLLVAFIIKLKKFGTGGS